MLPVAAPQLAAYTLDRPGTSALPRLLEAATRALQLGESQLEHIGQCCSRRERIVSGIFEEVGMLLQPSPPGS